MLFSTLPVLGLALGAVAAGGSQSACQNFKLNNVANVRINATTYYAPNSQVFLSTNGGFLFASNLPGFCRLQLIITTNSTGGSSAQSEVWLPDTWNGRSLAVGNGGWSGGVNVADLGNIAVKQGFAGMSTDTGHQSSALDGTWGGPHNDNAIIDWGYRAFRQTVLSGKQIIQQYYSQNINKSYYLGCSSGGREGLKEVQDFPEDFDGVVVGSPANWWSHLQGWSLHLNQLVQPSTSSRFITSDQWTNIIGPEVMRQCDALDGLADGIINDPRICSFNVDALTGKLSADQLSTLKQIYTEYWENGTYVFGSYYPGGEAGYPGGLVGSTPFQLGLNYFQYFVTNNTGFQLSDYNAAALALADQINPGQANAINPNLTAYAGPSHNGKVIHYVGWADQLISVGNSIHYYETVRNFTEANTNMAVDDFYRLFPVPGMQHCSGGNGATSFGAAGDSNAPTVNDAQHNVLAAIVAWVENGTAPDTLIASSFNGGSSANGVNFTRPICKFPLSLMYKGSGSTSSADSFECVETIDY